MSPGMNDTVSYPRSHNRSLMKSAACVSCHNRKIRCDASSKGFPCSNCVSSRRPDCVLHQKRRRHVSRPPNSYVTIRRKEDASATPSSLNARREECSEQRLVEFVDKNDATRLSIQRGVRIIYIGDDVSNINFLVHERAHDQDGTVHHLPLHDVDQRPSKFEVEAIPKDAFILPDKAVADKLVEAYFTVVNPGCPLVEEDLFMKQYSNQSADDPASLLLLQAILLAGAHVSLGISERAQLKSAFYRRAKTLFDARFEKNRDIVVRAALLLTWHSDGLQDPGSNSWYWIGIAVRTAIGLGMHRDAAQSPLKHHDMKTWRRLWWILFQFDVMVSISYGHPPAINLEDSDCEALDLSDFDNCGPKVQVEYVIQRTELCKLIAQILRGVFGLGVGMEDRKTALKEADESLAQWCLGLPPHLQLSSPETNLWTAWLHLTCNNFLILLHRPRPKASRDDNNGSENDSEICSAASIAIGGIFEAMLKADRLKNLWMSEIHTLFTVVLQISVELKVQNPSLAVNALHRFDVILSSIRGMVEYWDEAQLLLHLFESSPHAQYAARLRRRVKGQDHSSAVDHSSQAEPLAHNEMDIQAGSLGNFARTDSHCNGSGDGHGSNFVQEDWRHMFTDEDLDMELPLDAQWREIYWDESDMSGPLENVLCGWT